MQIRTYGWVQNPSDFNKLKLVVQILDSSSSHYQQLKNRIVQDVIYFEDIKSSLQGKLNRGEERFTFRELVGTQRNSQGEVSSRRADAVADSLIQITIIPQSFATTGKKYTDNWTSQGYLSWALALGFLKHTPETDMVTITELGRKFSQSSVDPTEDEYLLRAISAYPPAARVMNILENSKDDKGEYVPLSKFQIGSQLGFKGEPGYTSHSHELVEQALLEENDPKELQKLRHFEGTSDKYARMIASWLIKLKLVKNIRHKIISTNGKEISGYQRYLLTAKGVRQVRKINGNSSNRRIQKYVPWAMLGTKAENLNYVRTRRAIILNYLTRSTSMDNLKSELQSNGFNDSFKIIQADILGLNGIGIRINHSEDWKKITLKDSFEPIEIPEINVTQELVLSARAVQKKRIMESTNLPMKFYELIDIAYAGKRRSRDFELLTMELLKEGYGFETQILGGGLKPDGIAYNHDFGIIVDTKAYGDGYSPSQSEVDKMVRYVEDNRKRDTNVNNTQWWLGFPETISYQTVYFLWVSSFFTGQFRTQIENAAARSQTEGAALGVENLLVGADKFLKGQLSHNQIQVKIKQKTEITWD